MRSVSGRLAITALCWLGAACADTPVAPPALTTCATPVALRVGEVREFSGSTALSCIVVAAADVPSDVLFITANATAVQDDLRQYLVRSTFGASAARASTGTVSTVTADTAHGPTVAGSSLIGEQAGADPSFGSEVEHRVRLAESRLLRNRSLSAPAAAPAERATAAALAPAVGDTLILRVGNATTADLCSNFTTVRAVVKALGRRGTVALDVNAPSGGFSDADFRDFATEFDAVTFPTDSSWFGNPSDINRDGRVTILFTPEINRLSAPGSLGYAGGFFFAGDLLPRDIPSQNYRCPASNEQEILYLLAADPNGQVNGNRFSLDVVRESARGTMAHELQHMINQGVRQVSAGGTREVDWLNEGLSHFAEEVVGRAARKYGDMQRLNWNNVLADLDDFDSYFRQNLLRLRFWLDRPDLASPISARSAFELAPRGAAWALVRFTVDQYGGANPRALTRALVAGPQVDVANLVARAGVPFDRVLPGFLVASYGDAASPSVSAAYRYASWDTRNVMQELNGGPFPLRVAALPTDTVARSLSGSGNYFFVSRAPRAEPTTFRMLDPAGGPINFAGARVYVVRLR
jgi:hypothetical protein